MPGGRPRKPIALKILDGTYRADRDGPAGASVPAGGAPEPPPDLAGEARAFWGQVVPGLCARGVAAACDAPALACMCQWWARYRRFGEMLDQSAGAPAEEAPTPANLYRLVLNTGIAWSNFDKIACRFGLTPADRAKLRVSPPAPRPGVQPRDRGGKAPPARS
jgi:P27 family predicted phage terminase small subunit